MRPVSYTPILKTKLVNTISGVLCLREQKLFYTDFNLSVTLIWILHSPPDENMLGIMNTLNFIIHQQILCCRYSMIDCQMKTTTFKLIVYECSIHSLLPGHFFNYSHCFKNRSFFPGHSKQETQELVFFQRTFHIQFAQWAQQEDENSSEHFQLFNTYCGCVRLVCFPFPAIQALRTDCRAYSFDFSW